MINSHADTMETGFPPGATSSTKIREECIPSQWRQHQPSHQTWHAPVRQPAKVDLVTQDDTAQSSQPLTQTSNLQEVQQVENKLQNTRKQINPEHKTFNWKLAWSLQKVTAKIKKSRGSVLEKVQNSTLCSLISLSRQPKSNLISIAGWQFQHHCQVSDHLPHVTVSWSRTVKYEE